MKLIQKEIYPVIEQVEVVSGYRSKEYNQKAGGAKNSHHLYFGAVDLIPKTQISKNKMNSVLISIWDKQGKKYNIGLGLYSKKRFHLDTFKYRKW